MSTASLHTTLHLLKQFALLHSIPLATATASHHNTPPHPHPLNDSHRYCIETRKADVYNCFIQHTMNPFTAIRGHIQPPCTKFNDGIDKSITKYIESVATRQAKN
mmetsp:Transcript_16537/g.45809  ORF Transcript_16537/g.45809 Transcript_16537/m.45809 type:complete len:105 (+) Transcript_16537:669-983(+)